MKKILFILIFITTVVFGNQKTLVIGMELAYPPFEMSDTNGNPSGVSVDIMKAYAKFANIDIEIKNIEWTGLIPALKTGKIDAIISSMTITDERKKTIDFTIPYAQTYLAILAPKKSDINSIDDLNKTGKKVAVKKGSTGNIYAINNIKNAEILLFDKENTAMLEVIQEKADGFLYDQLTIYRNQQKHPDTTKAILTPFQEEPEYWGIGVRKGDTNLKNSLNAFINSAKNDGTFDEIANKHLKDVKKTFDKLGIEFFF